MRFAQALARRLARAQRRAPARAACARFADAPGAAARARTGRSAGTRRRAGASSSGQHFSRALDRPPRLHRHLALDRPRARGDRGDAHQPRPPGREAQPLRAAPGRARPRSWRPSRPEAMSEAPRHVHFVAIGGTGMGSLAGLLQARGLRRHRLGRDALPADEHAARAAGASRCTQGFRAEHVLERPAGSRRDRQRRARRTTPRRARRSTTGCATARSRTRSTSSRSAGKHSVVVAGHARQDDDHEPARVAAARGRARSVAAGRRRRRELRRQLPRGQGEHFVVEGDEYDTAFFDKTPKFLHYRARTLLLTSVEFDHADIYRDLEHVKQRVPHAGGAAARGRHARRGARRRRTSRDVAAAAPCRVVGYGVGEARRGGARRLARARARRPTPGGTRFELVARRARSRGAAALAAPRPRTTSRTRSARSPPCDGARRAARGGARRAAALPRREAPPGGARRGARRHRARRLRAPPDGGARDARRRCARATRAAASSPSSSRAPTPAGARVFQRDYAEALRRGGPRRRRRACRRRRSTAPPAR